MELAKVINALAQRHVIINMINIDKECKKCGLKFSDTEKREALKKLGYAEQK